MSTLTKGFVSAADAQVCFRGVLRALSYPGEVITLENCIVPPLPLSVASASILLTLSDPTTAVSLPADAEDAQEWLIFHTGAKFRTLETADFVVANIRPPLSSLYAGSDDDPETGATLILDVSAFDMGRNFRLTGPGIESETIMLLPFDAAFIEEWRAQSRRSPCGVDILLCAGGMIIGLPRSLTIEEV